ncbi:MAG: TSUP family transporter [Acidimicrobiales bacterium]
MDAPATLALVGLGVGVIYGTFGVGSAFATPILSLLGVPGMAAVVGPLPALLPGSAAGAWSYARQGKVDWQLGRRTLAGALPPPSSAPPPAVPSAARSCWCSGIVLAVVGLRAAVPATPSPRTERRRGAPAGGSW